MKNGPYELVIPPPEYPGKRYRGRYCYLHRLVWWQETGEILTKKDLIHHRNEKKRDNEIENLERHTADSHNKLHAKDRPAEIVVWKCSWCKKNYEMRARNFRSRKKQFGHSNFCCSRSCQVKKQQKELKERGGRRKKNFAR